MFKWGRGGRGAREGRKEGRGEGKEREGGMRVRKEEWDGAESEMQFISTVL